MKLRLGQYLSFLVLGLPFLFLFIFFITVEWRKEAWPWLLPINKKIKPWIDALFWGLVVLTLGQVASRKILKRLPQVTFYTSIISQLIQTITWILAFLVILERLGVSVGAIVTTLGIGGLALSLAIRPTLENLIAGIQIYLSQLLQVGDYIAIQNGPEGYVEDLTWRYVLLRTLSGNLVTIPNHILLESVVTNYNRPNKSLIVRVMVGISYSTDLEKAQEAAHAAIQKVQSLYASLLDVNYQPRVHLVEFGESQITVSVSLAAKDFSSQFPLRTQLIYWLKKMFDEYGVQIPFPTREIYLKKTD